MQSESLNDLIQIAAFTARLKDDPELESAFRGFLKARNKEATKQVKAAARRIDKINKMVASRTEKAPAVDGFLSGVWERLKATLGSVAMPQLGQPLATYAGEAPAGLPITFAYPEDVAVSELRVEPVKPRTVRGVLVRGHKAADTWSLDVFYLGEAAESTNMEYLASRPFGMQHQTATIQLVKDGVYAFVLRQDGQSEQDVKCNLVWVKDGRIYATHQTGE